MDFDSYIDEGENYDDGKPRLVEDYESYKVSKPVEKFFKLLEIEKQSFEETVETTGFKEQSVEKAKNYYAQHYEEFNQQVDSGFEFDVAEDAKLPAPDETPDISFSELEKMYHAGCEILREAPEKSEYRELAIDEIVEVDNGMKAKIERKNGVEGSVAVYLRDETVDIETSFSDEDCGFQVSADDLEAVEKALNFSFGAYKDIVKENQ